MRRGASVAPDDGTNHWIARAKVRTPQPLAALCPIRRKRQRPGIAMSPQSTWPIDLHSCGGIVRRRQMATNTDKPVFGDSVADQFQGGQPAVGSMLDHGPIEHHFVSR